MDSLADDITFGLAPATVIFSFMKDVLQYPAFLGAFAAVLPYLAFLIAVFSACRLAKFNIDTRQTTSFIGLPTPANALFWSSLIVGGK
jgi:CDP-diacylglycerol--serine O-phosphatidyltransferase